MDRTVAVTGGSGKLGRAVVSALIDEGRLVVNFDRVPSPDSRARFIRTDLTDYGQVVEALSGIEEVHRGVNAVVHLAAIPGAPSRRTSPRSTTTWCRPSTSSRPPSCSRFTIWSGLGLQRDIAWLPLQQRTGVRATR
jgi:NAD(P)-dependent dehydrogenase (short-subunit alcohol dehydrogenase family)